MASIIGDVSFGRFLIFLAVIILTLVVGNTVGAYIKRWIDLKEKKGWFYAVLPKLFSYSIYLSGFYCAVYKIIHFDLQAFAAAFGIIGLLIAFSSQHTLQNIIAGLLMFVDRSIKEGDYIEFNGTICKVVDISLRKTYLRARDGRFMGVPNSSFMTTAIVNYSRSEFFRIEIMVSVSPDADVERAMGMLYGIAVEHKDVVPKSQPRKKSVLQMLLELPPDMKKYEPKVFLTNITKDKSVLVLYCWITDIRSEKRIASEVLQEAKKQFKQAEIALGL
ncbi:MAG: mechanosensitive ion channel domain-containing protein [Candidatus Woesearchaeota archaeon]